MTKAELLTALRAKHDDIEAMVEREWPAAPAPAPASADPSIRAWDFTTMAGIGTAPTSDWQIQAKAPDRVKLVPDGLQLTTNGNDTQVFGSGEHERCDLRLNDSFFQGTEGREDWISHIITLAPNFQFPAVDWGWNILFACHNHSGGQGTFKMEIVRDKTNAGVARNVLRLRGYGGLVKDGGRWQVNLLGSAEPMRGVPYRFDHHIRWSSQADGFARTWLEGKLSNEYKGPTRYKDFLPFLKLHNYHAAFASPRPSSVIHSRVRLGKTPAVSMFPIY